MAFSNEYLTEEEIELIKKTELDSLLYINKFHNEIICDVDSCTTDREKKIWLINCVKRADFNPRLKEDYFVIFYGAIHKDNLIELCLKKLGKEEDPSVKKKYDVDLIYYWAIKEIKICPKLKISERVITDMLEEMMTAYGICGKPEHKGPGFDGRIKAFIKEYE